MRIAHKAGVDKNWFKARKREVGISDEKLGAIIGRDRSTVTKIINGDVRFDLSFVDGFAEGLKATPAEILSRVGVSGVAEVARQTDQPPTRTADSGETAPVLRLDLSYAMGPGTNLDDSHVEGEPVEFDIGFLRTLTPSTPDRLRIVNGSGDSMLPTIHDREELIIDLNQTRLNMQDRIWAISLYGAGALKRLRTIGPNRILVISDNPDVPNQEVDAGDITIAGRLVGSIKRH